MSDAQNPKFENLEFPKQELTPEEAEAAAGGVLPATQGTLAAGAAPVTVIETLLAGPKKKGYEFRMDPGAVAAGGESYSWRNEPTGVRRPDD